jgi:hypothetical protein
LRVKGKLTNCETGDRLVVLKKPIPRNLQIGKYLGKMFHSGQPEFQNRNPYDRAKTCHKCLKPGHLIYECPNDWVCRKCEQSGHKMMDCPQDFHDNEADDPVHNGDKSTEIQPLVENTEATTSKPEALPVSKTSNGNNKQHANKSGPQKTVKMTNSDNNTDKSQSSIDRFIRTLQRRLAANARTPPTPTEDLHDKSCGTKKNKIIVK